MPSAIHLQYDLELDTESCFKYFTCPELLGTWLCDDAYVEPYTNGDIRLTWNFQQSPFQNKSLHSTNEPPHNPKIKGGGILVFSKNHLVSFSWQGPSAFNLNMNDLDPPTQVSIAFYDTHDHHTEVHLIHSGWPLDEKWQSLKEWYLAFWHTAFNKLQMHITAENR